MKTALISCIVLFILVVCEFGYCFNRDIINHENKVVPEYVGGHWELDTDSVYRYYAPPTIDTVKLPVCPKCGEVGCIYEDIDSMSDGTDKSTYNAIMYIAKERKLTEKQIQLLLTEYYL